MSETGLTTIQLKKINKSKVYHYIYQQHTTSKLQIVQELQMGLSTVSQNLTLLEQDGYIQRNGYFDSKPRPSRSSQISGSPLGLEF